MSTASLRNNFSEIQMRMKSYNYNIWHNKQFCCCSGSKQLSIGAVVSKSKYIVVGTCPFNLKLTSKVIRFFGLQIISIGLIFFLNFFLYSIDITWKPLYFSFTQLDNCLKIFCFLGFLMLNDGIYFLIQIILKNIRI